MSDRDLAQLLQDVTPQPPVSVDFDELAAQASRRRRTMAGATLATAVVIVGAAVAVPTLVVGGGTTGIGPAGPVSRATTYTVDAPLLSVRGGPFMACQIELTSLPPAGCAGVPVTGVNPAALATATRYGEGTISTKPMHLVGIWNGRALALTHPPTPAHEVTPIPAARCAVDVHPPDTTALMQRIGADNQVLRAHGIDVIRTEPCGGIVAIYVAVADRPTIDYLTARYGTGKVEVYGWLVAAQPADRSPAPTSTYPPGPHPPARVTARIVTRLYPKQLQRGVAVPTREVFTRSTPPGVHTTFAYGLAMTGSADTFGTYPVKSVDGGRHWVVAGPKLHIPAAQGGQNVTRITATSARVAAAWGDWIVLTTDGGKHWWGASFADLPVQSVALTAAAGFLADIRGTGYLWQYQSSDGGRAWRLLQRS